MTVKGWKGDLRCMAVLAHTVEQGAWYGINAYLGTNVVTQYECSKALKAVNNDILLKITQQCQPTWPWS